jgi:O-antigen ligase
MWLQTWFGAGIVGVALLASTMLLQLRYCLRTRDLASLMVLAFVFVYGMAEASHLSAAPSILSVIWAVWITGQRSEGAGQQGPAGARAAGFARPHRQGLAAATPSRARP